MITRLLSRLLGKRVLVHSVGLAVCLSACLAVSACSTPGAVSTVPAAGGAARVSATATPHPFTYVALGASDAFGIGTNDPQHDNWPTLLALQLGADTHLVNLGVPGTTLKQALDAQLPVAVDAHPDIVTVWLAVNDLLATVPLATYTQQLDTVVAALRDKTGARVFVGNVPDLALLPRLSGVSPTQLGAQIVRWNQAIAGVCAAHGAHVVDLYTDWSELAAHPEYVSADGFHPSTLGAERLAEIFAAAIRQTPAK
jgi:acyl-CoA thioesterase I